MPKFSIETTLYIFAWCILLSVLWTGCLYELVARGFLRPKVGLHRAAVIPALLVAPPMVVLGYRLFGINLIFPVREFASISDLIVASLAPAIALFVGSGLATTLRWHIRDEYSFWSQKSFVRLRTALGLDVRRGLRQLVFCKALLQSWTQSLPWLFGELVIVEAVFNAPGLGLESWHLARMRDFAGLTADILLLLLIYAVVAIACAALQSWIGRKLESYT